MAQLGEVKKKWRFEKGREEERRGKVPIRERASLPFALRITTSEAVAGWRGERPLK